MEKKSYTRAEHFSLYERKIHICIYKFVLVENGGVGWEKVFFFVHLYQVYKRKSNGNSSHTENKS